MPKYIGAIDQGTTSTPTDPVRPRRADRGGRTSASTRRSTRRPAGSSTTPTEVWRRTREVIERGARAVAASAAGDVAAIGHHQPARDDRRVGPRDGRADPQRDRLAGHAHRPRSCASWPARRAWTACASAWACRCRRTSPGPKITWILDNVAGARERAESGRAGVRDDGHVGAVEPDRRPARRRARDRRDEREPHDADGPADARLARAEPRADGDPALDAAARSAPRARSTARLPGTALRGRPVSRASSATSRRRCSARPASSGARRRTPTAPGRSCS